MATERFIIEVSTRGVARARRSIESIGHAANQTRKLLAFMRAALVVFASVAILRGLASFIDTLTRMNNRLRLVTGSAKELATVQAALFQVSQRTRTDMEANVDLFSKLARTTTQLKLTYGDLIEVTEAVALATKISGSATETATAGLIQFGQGLASGVLAGEELRSVTENLPRLAAVIGKEFGIAGDALQKFGKANPGVVTTVRIVKALTKEFPQLSKEIGLTRVTILDAFTKFNNQLILFLGGLGDSLRLGEKVDTVLQFIARHLVQITLALIALAGVTALNIILNQIALLNSRVVLLATVMFSMAASLVRVFTAVLVPFTLIRTVLVGIGGAVSVIIPLVAIGRLLAGVYSLAAAGMLAFAVSIRTAGVATTIFGGLVNLLILPLRGVAFALGLIAAATIANPLFITGAVVVAGLVAAFVLFRGALDNVFVSLGGFKGILDIVLAAAVATGLTMVAVWQDLPAAADDVATQIANAFIRSGNEIVRSLNATQNSWTSFLDGMVAALAAAVVFVVREWDALMDDMFILTKKGVNLIIEGFNAVGKAAADVFTFFGKTQGFEPVELFDVENIKDGDKSIKDAYQAYLDIARSGPITGLFRELQETDELVNASAGAANTVAQKWVDEFNRIKAENPTDFLIGKFQDLSTFLQGMLAENKLIDLDILKNLFPTIAGAGELENKLISLGRSAGSLVSSISPLAAALIKLEQAQKLLKEAATAGVDIFKQYGITTDEVMRRIERNAAGVGNAATDMAEKIKVIGKAFFSGSVNAEEYRKAIAAVKLEFLDTQTDAMSGFERGLARIALVAEDSASLIEDSLTSAFDAANKAFSDFLETGTFNFRDFIRGILAELAKLAFNQLLAQIVAGAGAAFAGGGAGAQYGANFKVPATLPGFANGGDFTVAGSGRGGVDSQLVAFRATPGERVSVETQQQQRSRDSGGERREGDVVVHNTFDPNIALDAINSPAGARIIRTMIQRDPTAFRKALSV